MMNTMLLVGMAGTLAAIIGLSVWSGARNRGGEPQNGTWVVAGVIIGTLVGGSSTVGTAQLAYTYGMSAWWFTLGGGIACLILALIYTGPLRRAGCLTLVGIIRKEYGSAAGMAASILSTLGTFLNIIAQLISATAVFAVVFPSLDTGPATVISAVVMALYVVFGGTKGAGAAGIVKTALLYVSMVGCGAAVLHLLGGISAFAGMVRTLEDSSGVAFFSLIARGVGTDAGACLSLILGVLTTQNLYS